MKPEFALTLTSGVAKDNDRPIGHFFHESDAASCGLHLLLSDKNGDAPEYLGYSIQASPPSGGDAVAWLIDNGESKKFYIENIDDAEWYRHQGCTATPLYTSPRVVDDEMVMIALRGYDSKLGQSKFEKVRAALQAALGEGK